MPEPRPELSWADDCIASVTTGLRRVPLPRPWGPDVTTIDLIEVTVTTAAGRVGHGFSWTPTIGGAAVEAMLRSDIAPRAVGSGLDPEVQWDELWWQLHEAGSAGVTTFALAGLDLALWDLRARTESASLGGLLTRLGRRPRPQVEVYGSGVNLHYPLEDLLEQARRWVGLGYDAVKMKVGGPDLAVDVDRVAAVRDVIGPDRRLMIDANQRWDLRRALAAASALERFQPAWLEEPLLSDDLAAHVELRRETAIPIAVGESIHSVWRFREWLDAGAADILQPNVIRVGGITPFLRIADEATTRGATVHPHLLPELSGQLAPFLPEGSLVEAVDGAMFAELGILAGPGPIDIQGPTLTTTDRPGLGLDLRSTR